MFYEEAATHYYLQRTSVLPRQLKINGGGGGGGAHQCPGHLVVNLFRLKHPVPKGTHECLYIPSEIRAKRIR